MFGNLSVAAENLAAARGGRTLFADVSFSVAPGRSLELRGPNGSGKTTLLRILAGFLRQSAGRVRFDNCPEPQLALHYLGHANALKAPLDLNAHVRFWMETLGTGFDGEKARAALGAVGLGAIADLPASALSQGQSRRLALARLICAPRPIWLLDEPAASLDARGKVMLDALIAAHCAKGGLVVAALHEPLGAAMSDRLELAP